MRIVDARGERLHALIDDALALVQLAVTHNEADAAAGLLNLCAVAEMGSERNEDVRPALYEALDRVDAALLQSTRLSTQSA